MSIILTHPSPGKISASTSRIYMYSVARQAPRLSSMFATLSLAPFQLLAIIRKECMNSKSISTVTQSKRSPIASHSMKGIKTGSKVMSCTGSKVMSCVASAVQRRSIRTHPAVIVAQGTTGEIVSTTSGLHVWAGKAGDPFWIEPDVLHAVGHAFQDGTSANLSGWEPSRAKNLFAGHTAYSIVLEVPDNELLEGAGDRRRIGVWAVSTLATDAGGWRSINRVGLPMIHPLFTQYNEDLGNRLNAGRPSEDFATYGEIVIKAIAGVVSANGTAENPKAYAERITHRFFPNMLPYEVGTPCRIWLW